MYPASPFAGLSIQPDQRRLAIREATCLVSCVKATNPLFGGDFLFEENMKPYAYEVKDNRGRKSLVFAGSTAYKNAVMFKYELKPLYEGTNESK